MNLKKRIILLIYFWFSGHVISQAQDSAIYKLMCNEDSMSSYEKIILYKKSDWLVFTNYKKESNLIKIDTNKVKGNFPKLFLLNNDSFICYQKGNVFKIEQSKKKKNQFIIKYTTKSEFYTDSVFDSRPFFTINKKEKNYNALMDWMWDYKGFMNGFIAYEKDTIVNYGNTSIDCWKVNFTAEKKYFSPQNSDLTDKEIFISKRKLVPVMIKYKIPQNIKRKNLGGSKAHIETIVPKKIIYKIYILQLEFIPENWL